MKILFLYTAITVYTSSSSYFVYEIFCAWGTPNSSFLFIKTFLMWLDRLHIGLCIWNYFLIFFFLYSRVNTWDGHVIWQIQTLITCISRCEQSFLHTYPSSLRIFLPLRMFPFLLLSSSAASFILRFFITMAYIFH